MKEQLNSYLITLVVVLAAARAAWLILHVASRTTVNSVGGSEAQYIPLQQSILKSN